MLLLSAVAALLSVAAPPVKPPIADKRFADEVFSIWLHDRPAEDVLRKQLISRARDLIH